MGVDFAKAIGWMKSPKSAAEAAALRAGMDINPFAQAIAACAIGDSHTASQANNNSYYSKLVRRSGGAIRDMGNMAALYSGGGKRIDQMITEQLPYALASGARVCFVQGGTNDLNQGATQEVTRSRMVTLLTTLIRVGIRPIVVSLYPKNSGTPGDHVKFNIWLQLYCRLNNIPYINVFPKLATISGAYNSALYNDALHLTTVGADLVADEVLAFLRAPYVAPFVALSDTAANNYSLIGNALSMADTNADGIPNGFFSVGSGGTYSIVDPVGTEIGKWARTTIAGGTNVGLNPTAASLTSLGWSNTDKIAVGGIVRWADTSQALSVTGNVLSATTAEGGAFIYQEKGGASGETLYLFEQKQLTAGTNINVNWFGTGTGTLDINRPIVVSLTQLGLA